MNEYYHKYLKYKIKYFEIKYGGKGKKKLAVPVSPIPTTPYSTPLPPDPTSGFSIITGPSTPKFRLKPESIQALIVIKDDLLCRLIRCLDDPDLKITAKEQKTVKHQFYINIKKKAKITLTFHSIFQMNLKKH